MDFPTLNSCVDFYVITLVAFNEECTEDLRDTGVAPLTGNAYYTLVSRNYFKIITTIK